jgi:hypothetical protein
MPLTLLAKGNDVVAADINKEGAEKAAKSYYWRRMDETDSGYFNNSEFNATYSTDSLWRRWGEDLHSHICSNLHGYNYSDSSAHSHSNGYNDCHSYSYVITASKDRGHICKERPNGDGRHPI